MNLTHGEELWRLHTGVSRQMLTQLISLADLPHKMKEIERKYFFPARAGNVDHAISNMFSRVDSFVNDRKLRVTSLYTFVGIDQYYIFKIDGKEFHFRYRSGANRPPQVTVKFQMKQGSNLVRGEVNLGVEKTDPEKVQAFMSVIAAMAPTPEIFTIQQSGNIWVISDSTSGQKVEIVGYRVWRLEKNADDDCMQGAFAEIEPLETGNIEQALALAKGYESALGLSRLLCRYSIAELFRPGNENLLKQLNQKRL